MVSFSFDVTDLESELVSLESQGVADGDENGELYGENADEGLFFLLLSYLFSVEIFLINIITILCTIFTNINTKPIELDIVFLFTFILRVWKLSI